MGGRRVGSYNEGLVVAEVELPSADTHIDLPPWAGTEVSGNAGISTPTCWPIRSRSGNGDTQHALHREDSA